jgi:hypothetical protein
MMDSNSDLGHGTLMGMQELDQELDHHLGIYKSSNLGRDSTAPSVTAGSFTEPGHLTMTDQSAHTIIVEAPSGRQARNYDSVTGHRSRVTGMKDSCNNTMK